MLAVCHEGILMLLVIPSCHLVMEMAWYLQLDKNSVYSQNIFWQKINLLSWKRSGYV